jgi:HNH endonuclease
VPISDKTRKILWGRSGNRCAICKHELIIDSTPTDDESVIGDECHIISRQLQGPRHDPSFPEEKLDIYENLILLCRVHHKMIDDQDETYTADILRHMKSNHEAWVSQKLSDTPKPKPIRLRRIKQNIPAFLIRLKTGLEVLNIVENSYASSMNHEELESEEEVESIAQFLQTVRDWGDVGMDAEPSDRIRLAYELSKMLNDLEELGWLVFGARETQVIEGGFSEPTDWPISILQVVRKGSQAINTLEEEEPALR